MQAYFVPFLMGLFDSPAEVDRDFETSGVAADPYSLTLGIFEVQQLVRAYDGSEICLIEEFARVG